MSADILHDFAECLRSAGLEVEAVLADGLLHRCGTTDRPHRKDGAYKAFLDAPASIWWKNWRTGDEGTWTAKPEKEFSAAQRKALHERLAAAKADTKAEQERRWKAAAKLAASIWNRGRPSLSETKGSSGHRLATDGGRTACCPGSGSIRPDTEPTIHPAGQALRGDGQILSQGRQNVQRLFLHSCQKRNQGRPLAHC